ncbi:diguanylate cyclase/phosphodiesterase (GGDEF & EAL domains) with PAS/PAC sensor(s) [uncultured Gammaproteobacteria bacterium]|nr:diguanylate cyclase/phosphodiesterase (GGDEF & EAL domains) with PAS/PAC sensor(s) [uncultured Gammaproteobacteria bacterium]
MLEALDNVATHQLLVSVAGCLGYDVLDTITSTISSGFKFQLLVV